MHLNYRIVLNILGVIIAILGLSMMPSVLVSIFYREYRVAASFLFILIPMIVFGLLLHRHVKPKSPKLKVREGFVVVGASWLIASFFGALPYLMAGVLPTFIDAFFESTSSFTTTGSSIIQNIESVPQGLVFWRSFSQWLGGMGILVFAVSLLPALGISGQQIANTETPGPSLSKLKPKMADSAKLLYAIYGGLTLSAIVLLLLGGLSLFDSCIVAFGSVASGGLINYSSGAGHFDSAYVEFVITLFTILACINFTLYYSLVRGELRHFFKDRELHTFLGIFGVGFLLVSLNLWLSNTASSVGEALRFALFHTASFATTTGVYSENYDLWPSFSKMILFILMMIGACSASTGGGIKIIRIMVLVKLILRGFFIRLHPRAVVPIKIQDKVVTSDSMAGIMSFLYLYVFIYVVSVFVLSFENMDLITTLSATGAILNNIGAGFGLVGPGGSFAVFSPFSKLYMSFLMITGRLELFTILLFFMPSFWNPDR